MFEHIPISTLRDFCRSNIETLEIWLRRLIDDQLREKFGADYFSYQDSNQNFIIKKKTRDNVQSRRSKEPERYPRDIDAILLEEAFDIVFHPDLFKNYFREAFSEAFPDGIEEAKTFTNRIAAARNPLSHANIISIRQAEQVICYSNDIIDSLKGFYRKKGLQKMYNVPMFIQVTDSKGNTFHEPQIKTYRNSTGRAALPLQSAGNELFPGDTLKIEVVIDPSFNANEYQVAWMYSTNGLSLQASGNSFTLAITNTHIREDFTVYCTVKSPGKGWYRLGDCDDQLSITYRVLPLNI